MQARAVVDIDMYVCVAIFCLYVNYYSPAIRVISIQPHALPPKLRW